MNTLFKYTFWVVIFACFYNNYSGKAQELALSPYREAPDSYKELIENIKKETKVELDFLERSPLLNPKQIKQYAQAKWNATHQLWLIAKKVDVENKDIWNYGLTLLREGPSIYEQPRNIYKGIEKVLLFHLSNFIRKFNDPLAELIKKRIIEQDRVSCLIFKKSFQTSCYTAAWKKLFDNVDEYKKVLGELVVSPLLPAIVQNNVQEDNIKPTNYNKLIEILQEERDLVGSIDSEDIRAYLLDKLLFHQKLWDYLRTIDKKHQDLWDYGWSVLEEYGTKTNNKDKSIYSDIEKVLRSRVNQMLKEEDRKMLNCCSYSIIERNNFDYDDIHPKSGSLQDKEKATTEERIEQNLSDKPVEDFSHLKEDELAPVKMTKAEALKEFEHSMRETEKHLEILRKPFISRNGDIKKMLEDANKDIKLYNEMSINMKKNKKIIEFLSNEARVEDNKNFFQ